MGREDNTQGEPIINLRWMGGVVVQATFLGHQASHRLVSTTHHDIECRLWDPLHPKNDSNANNIMFPFCPKGLIQHHLSTLSFLTKIMRFR